MKRIALIVFLSAGFLFAGSAMAQVPSGVTLWQLVGSNITQLRSSWHLKLSDIGSGVHCLHAVDGVVSGTVPDCGGGGGSSATTTINSATGPAFTFASTTDTNILLSIITSGHTATFTPAWTGQLAPARGGTGTNTLASLTVGTGLSVSGGQNVLIGTSTQISLGSSVVTSIATGTTGNIFNASISSNVLTLNLPFASASNTGQLQAADWTTFNNKQTAGNYITGLTGDAAGSGPGSAATTVTGIQGKSISLATGYLKYTGAAWTFDNSTFLTAAVISLNGLSGASQTFATTTSGSLWTITSSGTVHTWTIPATPTFTGITLTNSTTTGVSIIPNGTNPTVSQAGAIAHDTTQDQLLYGSQPNVLMATSTKTMTIVAPTATEDDDFFITDVPITITMVKCNVRNSNTSSFTFSLPHSIDRSSASANLFSTGQVCTATTTPQTFTSFSDNTLAAGEAMWATSSAVTLASTSSITIFYKYDRQ